MKESAEESRRKSLKKQMPEAEIREEILRQIPTEFSNYKITTW